jgi:hypothetical protein
MKITHLVIPAQVGILFSWIPAPRLKHVGTSFVGMTADTDCWRLFSKQRCE